MRRTNKKVMKKADDKKGVILVTVIFIVAMALLFITTALTISIASRQRVYSNAKSDQARLTVTSLAQSIWQAIYSQQINDAMLSNLADGTGGNGSYVTFSSNAVPGMGTGGTESSAYFYRDSEDADKIIIECKCSIDGVSQCYRMVLEKNASEGIPSAMFDIAVNLGDGGLYDSVISGFDVDYFNQTGGYGGQVSWRPSDPSESDDNIVFLHNPTFNDIDNMGFYSTLVTDGLLTFRDAVFARDVYMIGRDSGFDIGDMHQGILPTQRTNGTTGDLQYGDMYFWGSSTPIRDNGTEFTGSFNGRYEFRGINNIYFENQRIPASVDESGNPVPAQENLIENLDVIFDGAQSFNLGNGNVTGSIHYEDGITGIGVAGGVTSHNEGTPYNVVEGTGIQSFIETDPDLIDTIGEVEDTYGSYEPEDPNLNLSTTTTIGSGSYRFNDAQTVSNDITFNVDGGDIYLFIDGGSLSFNSGKYIKVTGDPGCDNRLYIFLKNGATISLTDNSGIYDTRCFNGGLGIANIVQDAQHTPRCVIFSMYTGGAPLVYGGNQNRCVTAYLGFYPNTSNGSGGGRLSLYNIGASDIFYGRISAGGIDKNNQGNFLYMPYCPGLPGTVDTRDSAYRDNTDYSVVVDECGYFTTTA